jgi:murein L,D-transpeptidase YcbB/YkuD
MVRGADVAGRSVIVVMMLAGPVASAGALDRPTAEDSALAGQRLSASGRAVLRALVDEGLHPDLSWPDFREHRESARSLYEAGGYELAWIRDGLPTEQARAVVRALQDADTKGLDARDYDGASWARWFETLRASAPSAEPDQVRFDVALTVSVIRYVSDLHAGRVGMRPGAKQLGLVRVVRIDEDDALDPAAFVRGRVVASGDVAAALATVEPPFGAYRRTVLALLRYLELARLRDGEPLPVPRRAVVAGERYAGAVALARRLRLLGDLTAGAEPQGDTYDVILADAAARFQRRHGLDATGQLDARTVRALNVPLSRRVEQLALTIERWRWLPHRFAAPPLVVNIPEFRLHLADPTRWLSMKVVVGRAYRHRTPVFATAMTHVIFRPFWNVPLSIQRDELVLHAEKDPGHLAAGGYEILDAAGRVVQAAPSADTLERLRSGALRLRQRPGPRNALGLVKFVFPNPHGVYLHDTPAQELFARSRRDFSHGCIRVEDPAALAAWVLRDEPGWTLDRIRAAMNGLETIDVKLGHTIPVFVLYGTALVTEDGEVRFFDDVYGADAALARALAEETARRSTHGR